MFLNSQRPGVVPNATPIILHKENLVKIVVPRGQAKVRRVDRPQVGSAVRNHGGQQQKYVKRRINLKSVANEKSLEFIDRRFRYSLRASPK